MGLKGSRLTWRITQQSSDSTTLQVQPRFTANSATVRTKHIEKIIPLNYKVYDTHGIITDPAGVANTVPIGATTGASPGWVAFSNSRFKMQLGTYNITLTMPTWAVTARTARLRIIDDPRLYLERDTLQQGNYTTVDDPYYDYPMWQSQDMYIYNNEGYNWEGIQFSFTYKNTDDTRFKILTLTPNGTFNWENRYTDGSTLQREMVSLDIIKVANT